MKVASITNYSKFNGLKNVSFGDDCGYVPSNYRYTNAMSDLSKKGYVVEGADNRSAFAKLHNDINNFLNRLVNSKQGEWSEIVSTKSYYSEEGAPKYSVHRWEMTKENFVNFMTRFWEKNKSNSFVDEKASVTNFLVNCEGMKKPGFFQMFSSKYAEYFEKSELLMQFIKKFIKTGQCRSR